MNELKKTAIKTDFIDEAKKEGLDIAEDAIAAIWKALVRVAAKYAAKSDNMIIKIAAPIIAACEAPVLALIDKIDGEDDER
jgi:spore maturation protein SpmB